MKKCSKYNELVTDLFSTGGACPSFNKRGKVWRMRGHVTSHLNQAKLSVYKDCHIVEYELTLLVVDSTPVSEYSELIAQKHEAEQQRKQEAFLLAKRDRELTVYEELKKKYEGK